MKRLSESIFNAGIKRNQGGEMRKEDDVNFLEKDDLYEYLKKRYKQIGKFDIDNWHANFICFPVEDCETGRGSYVVTLNYDRRDNPEYIEMGSGLFDKHPEIEENLKGEITIEIGKKYVIHNETSYIIKIYPKEKGVVNSFYIRIIDIILKNTDNPMFEKI